MIKSHHGTKRLQAHTIYQIKALHSAIPILCYLCSLLPVQSVTCVVCCRSLCPLYRVASSDIRVNASCTLVYNSCAAVSDIIGADVPVASADGLDLSSAGVEVGSSGSDRSMPSDMFSCRIVISAVKSP